MIFNKFKIKGVTLKNKIVVSPMCQYSANNGSPTSWHYNHLSNLIRSGAGMVMIESTAVSNNGKITHKDLCLSNSIQEKNFKKLKNFLSGVDNIPIGIQISHAGRKGSSFVPWIKKNTPLDKKNKCWQTFSSSPIKRDKHWPVPKELTKKKIREIIFQFKDTAQRAKRIGFDCLEVHMAHGYLLHQFLSPISNKRKDEYGLNKKNLSDFPIEVAKEIKKIWPKNKILGARITATDHLSKGISIKDSILLSKKLEKIGYDYVCVSSGGILPKTNMKIKKAFRKNLSKEIKKNTNIKVRTSGEIDNVNLAEKLIRNKCIDFVAVGKMFIKNPNWIKNETKKRKIKNYIPSQYQRCF